MAGHGDLLSKFASVLRRNSKYFCTTSMAFVILPLFWNEIFIFCYNLLWL